MQCVDTQTGGKDTTECELLSVLTAAKSGKFLKTTFFIRTAQQKPKSEANHTLSRLTCSMFSHFNGKKKYDELSAQFKNYGAQYGI